MSTSMTPDEIRADEAEKWAQAVIVSGKQGERIGAERERLRNRIEFATIKYRNEIGGEETAPIAILGQTDGGMLIVTPVRYVDPSRVIRK